MFDAPGQILQVLNFLNNLKQKCSRLPLVASGVVDEVLPELWHFDAHFPQAVVGNGSECGVVSGNDGGSARALVD